MAQDLDVTGIGNAIVDVIAHANDAQLARLGLPKGAMTLIDAARADELYGQMGPAVEVSGGSVANSMAGIASLGGSRRLHRQGHAPTSSARCSRTTSAPPASSSRARQLPRRPGHGALPDPGDARTASAP